MSGPHRQSRFAGDARRPAACLLPRDRPLRRPGCRQADRGSRRLRRSRGQPAEARLRIGITANSRRQPLSSRGNSGSLRLIPVPELDFDVAILGGGMGGYPAAIRASQLGLKVALVESDKLGGTCLHIGCIPTKALLESSELYHRVATLGAEFGLKAQVVGYDYPRIAERRDAVVNQLYKGVQYLMKKNKIEVVAGRGRVTDPNTIQVDSRPLKAKNLIVATGSNPKTLPGIEIDGKL